MTLTITELGCEQLRGIRIFQQQPCTPTGLLQWRKSSVVSGLRHCLPIRHQRLPVVPCSTHLRSRPHQQHPKLWIPSSHSTAAGALQPPSGSSRHQLSVRTADAVHATTAAARPSKPRGSGLKTKTRGSARSCRAASIVHKCATRSATTMTTATTMARRPPKHAGQVQQLQCKQGVCACVCVRVRVCVCVCVCLYVCACMCACVL